MKKCISCQKEIEDGAVFCPHCGAKQDGENQESAKKNFPINERAFCRVFRPSFFGGYQLENKTLYKFIANFLSLSSVLSKNEISEINHAFDTLLNNASKEYFFVSDLSTEELECLNEKYRTKNKKYELSEDDILKVDDEDFRYDFLSDEIFDSMKTSYNSDLKKHFSNVWLFCLLAMLNGNYSSDKFKFFKRIKNLFSITREDIVKCFIPNPQNLRNTSVKSFLGIFGNSYYYGSNTERETIRNTTINGILSVLKFNPAAKKVNKVEYKTKDETLFFIYTNESGEKVEISENNLIDLIPEDFDFYATVENKIKEVCKIEYQIQTLEQTEGKYAEIADKIAELARQERTLLDVLPGFNYQKF